MPIFLSNIFLVSNKMDFMGLFVIVFFHKKNQSMPFKLNSEKAGLFRTKAIQCMSAGVRCSDVMKAKLTIPRGAAAFK